MKKYSTILFSSKKCSKTIASYATSHNMSENAVFMQLDAGLADVRNLQTSVLTFEGDIVRRYFGRCTFLSRK